MLKSPGNNIVNLDEIRFAKKVVKDIPNVVKNLDKCIELLYNYSEYEDISKVLSEIYISKIMLSIFYEAYIIVLEENGVKK